jgi:VWFA-related protein
MKKYAVILVAFILLLQNALFAQQSPKPENTKDQPATTIRSTTHLVQVSVIVTDKKGQPIAGLKKEDFTVLDESKPQQIAFFSEASPAPPPSSIKLPATVYTNRYDLKGQDPGSVTVVLFDLLNTSPQDQARVRQQLIDFLKTLTPQDHVAMYGLTTRVYILHDFTQNSSELVATANHLDAKESAAYDASHPRYFDVPALANDPQFAQFQSAVNEADARVADRQQINRAQTTAAALTDIANHVATIAGRKNLVWVSGSFPLTINPAELRPDRDSASLEAYVNRATQALNRANLALYPVDTTGVMTNTSMDPQQAGNAKTLTCMDCTTEAPGTASAMFSRQNSRDAERVMAASTGGEAFYGSNDIVPAVKRAFGDGRYAYTIAFYPDHGQWNGEFRKLKIETRADGAKLRYRSGYIAQADSLGDDQARAKLALQQAAASPLDATALNMVVSGKLSEDDDRKVELHIALDPKQFEFTDFADHRKGEVDLFFVQRNAKGETISAEDQRVALDFEEKHYQYLAQSGVVFVRHEPISPQATELRILACDTASKAIGSVTIPVDPFLAALKKVEPPLKLENLK